MRLRSLLITGFTAASLAACALNSPMPRAPVSSSSSSRAPENKPAPVSVGPNQYLVQKGDNLYNIGRKFGIPHLKLAEINQLQAPYEIHVGQVLNINPKAVPTASSNKAADTAADDAEVVTSAISRPELMPAGEAANTAAAPAGAAAEGTKAAAEGQDIEAVADNDIQWQWPLAGKVSAGFDPQMNKGLNITGAAGQVINAAGAGKVIYSGMDVRGYGKLIIIKHNSNLLSVYAHQGNSLVKEGSFVTQGEKIATLPAASNNKPPMLHFEIRQKGKPVDPVSYLPGNPASNPGTAGNNSNS